jgi:predicted esterase/glutaredoxin
MLNSQEASSGNIEKTGLYHRIFLPDDYSVDLVRPLVVLVHGRAGDAKVMWTFSKIFQDPKPVIVAPQGFLADSLGGFSWWLPEDGSGHGASVRNPVTMDQLKPALDKLNFFLDQIRQIYIPKTDKIIGIGFSQGGGLISGASLLRPDIFTGVGLLASFVPQAVIDLKKKETITDTKLPKYFISHGTEDNIVDIQKAIDGKEALESFGAEVSYHQDAVGHKISSSGVRMLSEWYATLLLATFFICGFFPGVTQIAEAEIFQYVDDAGKIHFVDQEKKVPVQYKDQLKNNKPLPKITKVPSVYPEVDPNATTNKDYLYAGKKDVELFVTSWCGYCRKLESWMAENKIKHKIYDIEKDSNGRKLYNQLGGTGSVPMTRVGKEVIMGYNPGAIKAALK